MLRLPDQPNVIAYYLKYLVVLTLLITKSLVRKLARIVQILYTTNSLPQLADSFLQEEESVFSQSMLMGSKCWS